MDTLQNMRAFSCVAEAGSFTAAAAMLDTTTANVSRAVSNLEANAIYCAASKSWPTLKKPKPRPATPTRAQPGN